VIIRENFRVRRDTIARARADTALTQICRGRVRECIYREGQGDTLSFRRRMTTRLCSEESLRAKVTMTRFDDGLCISAVTGL
jgi:hypothetical protein